MQTIGLIQTISIPAMSVRPVGRRVETTDRTRHMATAVTAATLVRATLAMGMEAVTGDLMLAATAGAETVEEAEMVVEAAEGEAVVAGAAVAEDNLMANNPPTTYEIPPEHVVKSGPYPLLN